MARGILKTPWFPCPFIEITSISYLLCWNVWDIDVAIYRSDIAVIREVLAEAGFT